jgi:putative methylase
MLKLKQLESYLTEVDTFEAPKVELEQYSTSAHIAARMVYNAATSYEDIEGKVQIIFAKNRCLTLIRNVGCFVGDFGCGPGILSIASSLMGASFVCGFDVDQDALDTAWVNIHKLEIPNIDLTQSDVQTVQFSSGQFNISSDGFHIQCSFNLQLSQKSHSITAY